MNNEVTMKIVRVIVAAAAGFVGAILVYPIASEAPASYIGNFTAPWFAQVSLFLVVIIPPALAWSKFHTLPGMRRVTFFIGTIICIGALAGIYMAGRFAYETQAPPLDWFMVVGGSLLLVGGTIALLYWSFQENT
jgi:hypothetical protein